ncbi:MAG: multicopper oxidase family protein [Sporichthyaceae bacterium]
MSSAISRRNFLAISGGVGLGLVSGCASDDPLAGPTSAPTATSSLGPRLTPGSSSGVLTAGPVQVDLAGTIVTTWGYNGLVPGPEIRVRQGERVRVRLANSLTDLTTIHWHGVSLPNAMDGVPGVTQDPVAPGAFFDYDFVPIDAGSHMFHAHQGHQLDLGLYGPLIVDSLDPEPLDYDRDYVVMLDDWRDGLGVTDPGIHSGPHSSGTPAGAGRPRGIPGLSGLGGTEASPVPTQPPEDLDDLDDAAVPDGANPGIKLGGRSYPLFLVNGRPAADPATFEVRTGERVRLRLMNIAADTGFLVALAGHQLTVTHADGLPVEPVTVDAVRLGMGERYDVVVTATSAGAWQLAAVPESKRGFARAVVRYTDAPTATAPEAEERPSELTGRLLSYADLRYTGVRVRPTAAPDRVHDLTLSATSRINGQRFVHAHDGTVPLGLQADPLPVAAGELVRVIVRNTAVISHPMHLHGHPFWVRTSVDGTETGSGPLKDTVLVPGNGGSVTFDFVADNPGDWMFHCHNDYHMENGMARLFTYL